MTVIAAGSTVTAGPGTVPKIVIVEGRGPKMEPISPAVMSVRELITQLSQVEADLRVWRHPGANKHPEPAVAELVHHEQVIVRELRRRRARSQHLGSRSGPTRRAR